jgi:hypothetical protein
MAGLVLILIVLVVSCNDSGTSNSSPETPQPSQMPHPKLLTKEEQDTQWREQLAKYGLQVFSQIKVWKVEDLHPNLQFVRLHTCATEIASGESRYYTIGINFGFHHDLYVGAPLQEVLYGPPGWPDQEQVLGPVFNRTPQEQADEEESRKRRTDFELRHPPQGEDRHYATDPCNGQEYLR